MSDNEILNLILSRVNQIDEKFEKFRVHHSDQLGKVHSRIDEEIKNHNNYKEAMNEKHNQFKIECKQNDVKMEKRIGVVGTAAALITSFGVKILELLVQFIPKVIK